MKIFPVLRTLFLFLLAALAMAGLWSCRNSDNTTKPVRFAVLADPHLYDTTLGAAGPEFDAYLTRDVKMLAEGEAIIDGVVQSLIDQDPRPEFVLIPGDLTKDGEEQSHRLMISALSAIEAAGIEVYVVPGNHDIANPEAVRYDPEGVARVDSPDAGGFVALYADFGYAGAIDRDPASLSYIAEPAPGVRLFAIDSCRYRENGETPVVGGHIGEETRKWLLANLDRAREEGKTVIAMMHHGLVEHLIGQGEFLPDYLVEDWEGVGYELAAAGINLVFTGHYHTQNVTRREWPDRTFLVEAQTGSALTFPNPYRMATLDQEKHRIQLSTEFVGRLPAGAYPDGFTAFVDYSRDFTCNRMLANVERDLSGRFNLPAGRIAELAPWVNDAIMAHFAGDEVPTLSTFRKAQALTESPEPDEEQIGWLLMSLWHDLPPADNNVTVSLRPAS